MHRENLLSENERCMVSMSLGSITNMYRKASISTDLSTRELKIGRFIVARICQSLAAIRRLVFGNGNDQKGTEMLAVVPCWGVERILKVPPTN